MYSGNSQRAVCEVARVAALDDAGVELVRQREHRERAEPDQRGEAARVVAGRGRSPRRAS